MPRPDIAVRTLGLDTAVPMPRPDIAVRTPGSCTAVPMDRIEGRLSGVSVRFP